jgi:hypothetical protein
MKFITALFGNTYRNRILEVLLASPDKEFRICALQRQCSTGNHHDIHPLFNLVSDGIVSVRAADNIKFYSLNWNHPHIRALLKCGIPKVLEETV